MSKKTNKKQVGAKAKRAKGTAEARAKSAKPKDGMSLGAKVALTVFAVLMALSMMLPSIAAIIGTSRLAGLLLAEPVGRLRLKRGLLRLRQLL